MRKKVFVLLLTILSIWTCFPTMKAFAKSWEEEIIKFLIEERENNGSNDMIFAEITYHNDETKNQPSTDEEENIEKRIFKIFIEGEEVYSTEIND